MFPRAQKLPKKIFVSIKGSVENLAIKSSASVNQISLENFVKLRLLSRQSAFREGTCALKIFKKSGLVTPTSSLCNYAQIQLMGQYYHGTIRNFPSKIDIYHSKLMTKNLTVQINA